MSADAAKPGRKPRADAERNRERLIETAKACFAASGPDVALDEIARQAGVGIGTLYRHFPTRDAIIAAVYRREVEQLAASADRLLASMSPGLALHEWMKLFVDYIATKKVIGPALQAMATTTPDVFAGASQLIPSAIERLVQAGVASGQVRPDADPADLLRALIGFTYGNGAPGWQESALRLIDLLMAGLRPS